MSSDADQDAPDADPDAPDADTNAPAGMAFVGAGDFEMGCVSALDTMCDADENPQHTVTLDTFIIDLTEVTQADYQFCISAGVCSAPSNNFDPTSLPKHPVGNVVFSQAVTYCSWLTKRLPTEAEWEKAARGTDGRVWPWGNAAPTCEMLNFDRCIDAPTAVGSYPAYVSPYGLFDTAGNVSEWVSDWYDAGYYSSGPSQNPVGPSSGSEHGVRGSSYAFGPQSVRTSNRPSGKPDTDSLGRGFRCARSIE
jgi:formylglycine-generating enzyme required for sulfatase activity